MIKFPVRYNEQDQAVEDSDFVIIAHPFIRAGQSIVEKDEIGKLLASSLNSMNVVGGLSYNYSTKPGSLVENNSAPSDLKPGTIQFFLPAELKKKMNHLEISKFDRFIKKVGKIIEKAKLKYGGV